MTTYLVLRILAAWRQSAGLNATFDRSDLYSAILQYERHFDWPWHYPLFGSIFELLTDLDRLGVVELSGDRVRLSPSVQPGRNGHDGYALDLPEPPPPPPGDGEGPPPGEEGGGGLAEVLSHPVLFALDDEEFESLLDAALNAEREI